MNVEYGDSAVMALLANLRLAARLEVGDELNHSPKCPTLRFLIKTTKYMFAICKIYVEIHVQWVSLGLEIVGLHYLN